MTSRKKPLPLHPAKDKPAAAGVNSASGAERIMPRWLRERKLYWACAKFYQDPANMAAFEAWKEAQAS